MPSECPKCSKPLPQVETVEYRFCPHCGAEIAAESQQLHDAYLTMPPDPLPPREDPRHMDLSPETEKKAVAAAFDDQTSEPQPSAARSRPRLTPPDTPPPASLFRTRSAEKTPSIHTEEKILPEKDINQPSTTKRRNNIIAALIILALIILLLGGLVTF